ncbi:MAG TPA: hypothetical protein VHP99_05540 [Pyrinomonadaceae bacterium]|nr:hypothetical protein [Pyrinomonadaceae bacterium]
MLTDDDDDITLVSTPRLTSNPPPVKPVIGGALVLAAINWLNAAHCAAASRLTRSAASLCFFDFFRGFAPTVAANASNKQQIKGKVIENRDELLAISLSLATDLQIGNLRPVDRRS